MGPLLSSSPPLLPFPPAWDGNYFHETKVAAIILPDPIPEGQQQQLLLLHANGTTGMVHNALLRYVQENKYS